MARYDFLCNKCGLVTEETRSMFTSMESGKCPECSTKTERVFSHMFSFTVEGGTIRSG